MIHAFATLCSQRKKALDLALLSKPHRDAPRRTALRSTLRTLAALFQLALRSTLRTLAARLKLALQTPYAGCTAQACAAVDTPYDGCMAQACTVVDTPYADCTALACTDNQRARITRTPRTHDVIGGIVTQLVSLAP